MKRATHCSKIKFARVSVYYRVRITSLLVKVACAVV
jgi:hypothetical protein